MSTAPWNNHRHHCPKCGHYARFVGNSRNRRHRCMNEDCRHAFNVSKQPNGE